jgi:hypothetical protein
MLLKIKKQGVAVCTTQVQVHLALKNSRTIHRWYNAGYISMLRHPFFHMKYRFSGNFRQMRGAFAS